MGKKANPKLIGAFVVGAIILVVAGVLTFGTGQFFAERRAFVVFFEGSLSGLGVGAPVTFRGIKIGSVIDLQVQLDTKTMTGRIPVYIEFERDRVAIVGGKIEDAYKALIKRGLRAQLQMVSLVTGQLSINFDFHPGTPIKLMGTDKRFPELPTIPSKIEELTKKIQGLPLEELVANALSAIKGIDQLVNSDEAKRSLSVLNEALVEVGRLVHKIDSRISPIISNIEDVSKATQTAINQTSQSVSNIEQSVNLTLGDIRKLVQNLDHEIKPVRASLIKTSKAAQSAIAEAEKTIKTARTIIAEDSPLHFQISRTLEELSSAVRSIRILAEYLERHPEALVRGKGGSQ